MLGSGCCKGQRTSVQKRSLPHQPGVTTAGSGAAGDAGNHGERQMARFSKNGAKMALHPKPRRARPFAHLEGKTDAQNRSLSNGTRAFHLLPSPRSSGQSASLSPLQEPEKQSLGAHTWVVTAYRMNRLQSLAERDGNPSSFRLVCSYNKDNSDLQNTRSRTTDTADPAALHMKKPHS